MSKLTTSDLVLRDPVTGVHARAALPARLQTELYEALSRKESLSLILVHISFPKGAGPVPERIRNSSLTAFVARARAAAHDADDLFRIGGSDFALVLAGVSGDRAASIARKLLKAAHGTPLEEGLPFTLTLSMGVASFPADAQNHENLLETAKKRVREAQRRGQGHIVTQDTDEGGQPRATKLLAPIPAPTRKTSPQNEKTGPTAPGSSNPQRPTLVGRERERVDLHVLLDGARLVTVLGPDGVGKTSLATQVMHERAERHAHGVCFVSFQDAYFPDHITSAIAGALGLTLSSTEEASVQILGHLRDKDLLLVLDSFAPMQEAVHLLRDLIDAAPGVQVLATATERAELLAERVLPLDGISCEKREARKERVGQKRGERRGQWTIYLSEEELQGPIDDERQEGSDALDLFTKFAHQANPGFHPTPSDMEHIAATCRILDGTPLAIKLAAPWVYVLTCDTLASEIRRAALSSPAEGASSIALNAAWSLLPDAKREALARLSVFQGGFSERAAARAANVTPAQLASLVDKSLVELLDDGRYTLHPTTRHYTAGKLRSMPERERNARQRHSSYYLRTMYEFEPQLTHGSDHAVEGILDDIGREIGNLRAAWDWAVESGHEDGIGDALESLLIYYESRGLFEEGERELGRAAASLRRSKEGRGEVLGRALTRQARMATYLGRYDQAGNLLQEALVYLGGLHAPEETARALRGLGEVAYLLGKYDEALEFIEEARLVRDEDEEISSIWTTSPTLNIHDLISTP